MKTVFMATLLIASLSIPFSKAKAGIVMAVTGPSIELGLAVTGIGVTTLILRSLKNVDGDLVKDPIGWFGIIAFVAGEKAEQIEAELAAKIPEAPNFIRAKIAAHFESAAKQVKSNKQGLKSVVLKKDVANKLLTEVAYLDSDIQSKLFQIMTKRLEI